jgi:hypothetical protein
MGAVVGALGDLGYGVAYRVLDAQFFGVPQRRRRVFFVGHLGEPWGAPAEVLFECEGGAGDSAAGRETGAGVTAGIAAGAGVLSYTRAGHGWYGPGVGTLQAEGGDCGGGSESLITTTVSTLQGGGVGATGSTPNQQPGDTSSWAVAALTANGVGTCGADDNQAQAGHLIAQPSTVIGGGLCIP